MIIHRLNFVKYTWNTLTHWCILFYAFLCQLHYTYTRDVQTADASVRGFRSAGFFCGCGLKQILSRDEICGPGLTRMLFCEECIFFLIKVKTEVVCVETCVAR